jgi:hypothetical protein
LGYVHVYVVVDLDSNFDGHGDLDMAARAFFMVERGDGRSFHRDEGVW